MLACRRRPRSSLLLISLPGNPKTLWKCFCSTILTKRQQRSRFQESIESLEKQSNPDVESCVQLLSTCSKLRALAEGRQVHAHVKRVGLESGVFLANHLVMMYGKCGSLPEAREVFNSIEKKNIFSWTILITVCSQLGKSREALQVFDQMLEQGVRPQPVTFTSAINACTSPEFLPAGKALHARLSGYGYESLVIVSTSLVSMYSRCGSLSAASKMFNSMKEKNLVSWNAMIAAYSEHKLHSEALATLHRMLQEGIRATNLTFLTLLSVFDRVSQLTLVSYVHRLITEAGFEQDVAVGTTLVNVYAKCSGLEGAHRVLTKLREPNVVTWNVLISAYVQHGYLRQALGLFRRMLHLGVELDDVTFVNALGACCSPGVLADGRMIHACALEHSRTSNDARLESIVLNMYGKCGSLEDAEVVFESMPEPDLVAWNTMIGIYAQLGHARQALQLYERMQGESMEPDEYTYVSVLDACATLGAVEEGRKIHRRLGERGVQRVSLANALVNMYGKCGIVDEARGIFDKARSPHTWNVMIGAYTQHGHLDEAFEVFLLMNLEGAETSRVTFMNLFAGYANAGLSEKARECFVSMQGDHGVEADAGHFSCMVEALGKAGRLIDAEALILEMPYEPDVFVWTSFLTTCRSHGDAERGKVAALGAMELDPDVSAAYVALATIYTDAGE